MKHGERRQRAWIVAWIVVGAATAGGLLITGTGVGAAPRSCNVVVNSENMANNSVQTAINGANPGWKICLGPGSFPEQLKIATSGLTLVGTTTGGTVIDPASVASTTVDWDSSAPHTPFDPVILVANTTGVTISTLTVNGSAAASSITGCGTGFVGVDYQNSTGSLLSAKVTGIELAPSLLGCQDQLAIYAYTGWFTTGFVPSPAHGITVQSTVVNAYGKNGITCDDPGVACTLKGDTVTGIQYLAIHRLS